MALLICLVAGCKPDANAGLPRDPGLQQEDFGLGIGLGLSREEALKRAADYPGTAEVLVLSREELNALESGPAANLRTDRVILLCDPQADSPAQPEPGLAVGEIRAYLPGQQASVLVLLEQPVVKLNPAAATKLLGPPWRSSTDAEGNEHKIWQFAGAVDNKDQLQFTMSFRASGEAFALALKLSRDQ